jgi:hypothetical protein
MPISNFYCVNNETTKTDETDDFDKYCTLRDSDKAFYLFRGCTRRWMNESDEERGSSGISIMWPITTNEYYKEALKEAEEGESPNNISPIVEYSLKGGATILWMGDMETDFMDNIKNAITLTAADILFAPHHGRDSGKVPKDWLDDINPKIVIIGEAPSKQLNYYGEHNTITQNSAGAITLNCVSEKIHIYVSNKNYSVDFLNNERMPNSYGWYIGTVRL